MRPVFAYSSFFAALCCSILAFGAEPARPSSRGTTLLLQFEQPYPEATLTEVRNELGRVMRASGISFELKLFSELSPFAEFADLMVVKLRGKCRLEANSLNPSGTGALAFTHTSDGRVLPFVEVACDRVRSTIRPVLWGDQFRHLDEMMGRALARVIAHEIYHVMTRTGAHGESGIARHSLSGSQLVASELMFDPADLERMVSGSVASGGGI